MNETTYFPEVRCNVEQVPPPLDRIAEIIDIEGRMHQINVPQNMISEHQGQNYLPIGIVEINRRQKTVLIEFPVESGQGTARAWVKFGDLLHVTHVTEDRVTVG